MLIGFIEKLGTGSSFCNWQAVVLSITRYKGYKSQIFAHLSRIFPQIIPQITLHSTSVREKNVLSKHHCFPAAASVHTSGETLYLQGHYLLQSKGKLSCHLWLDTRDKRSNLIGQPQYMFIVMGIITISSTSVFPADLLIFFFCFCMTANL